MISENKKIQLKSRPYLLKNKIQNYAWGSRGNDAFIPKFLGEEGSDNKPYAELWMGTHLNAPSELYLNGSYIQLNELISQYPVQILGEQVTEKFSGKLPFLFKVLSAAEALSIQAHPNKAQAISLHARDAEHYPDDNHKLEIAIALTSLTALVGFKPFPDIVKTLKKYPEISNFIGHDIVAKLQNSSEPSDEEVRGLVKIMYSTLMNRSITDKKKLAETVEQLGNRLNKEGDHIKEEERHFLELKKKYGADVGLFSIFLLNLIHLSEGQGIFLAAGIPHAYIEGNIVECMSNSDNVIRAGLTPKFKDVQSLVEILTYDTKPVPILCEGADKDEIIYKTPAQEFQVTRWKLTVGQRRIEMPGKKPQILLIFDGNISISWNTEMESGREDFNRGQSILIPAMLEKFEINANSPAMVFKVEVP